jgi:hypothetical protein
MGDNINALAVAGVVCAIYYLFSEPFNLSNFVRYFLGLSVAIVAYSLSIEFFRSMNKSKESV